MSMTSQLKLTEIEWGGFASRKIHLVDVPLNLLDSSLKISAGDDTSEIE
jgi:hypothetical protein